MAKKAKPFYFIQPKDPLVKQYKELYTGMAAPDKHTLTIQVTLESVQAGEVGMVQQMITALQHYPKVIEKMVFAVDFSFQEVEDSELYLPAEYWKAEPDFQHWFHKLQQMPAMLFFLNDESARLYALVGDMIADNVVEIIPDPSGGKHGMVGFEGEPLIEVMHRLFNTCWWMLMFCHNTGFNPEPYIESIIADFGLPLTYQEVYEKYHKDAEKGIHFRMTEQP